MKTLHPAWDTIEEELSLLSLFYRQEFGSRNKAATGVKLNANVNSQRKKLESEEDIKEES